MHYLQTRANIESNKAFQRLIDKTQVLSPQIGRAEIVKNRLTHSYEVATSAEIIADTISTAAFKADYQKSVYNVSLLHDIGHPPFGHEGAIVISKKFKELGLEEGFSDNNNNFEVIEKNQIRCSDYELASLIKYPQKLYAEQAKYLQILDKAIDEDLAYFKDKIKINKRPTHTLSCQIMDEADRNTYTCADMSDCYCLGLMDESHLVELLNSGKFNSIEIIEFLTIAIESVKQKNKTLIKNIFSELKLKFNLNYRLGENLALEPINQELLEFREIINKICLDIYIFAPKVVEFKQQELIYLHFYLNYVLENKEYHSKHYAGKIDKAETDIEKLTFIRDMIANTTDNYLKKFYLEKNPK